MAANLPIDSRTVTDGVLNGTTTITSATAAFVASDVGRAVVGNTNVPPYTSIAAYVSATQVTLSQATTGGSLSGQTLTFTTTPATYNFLGQLWSLWQNAKHVSAAWIGQNQVGTYAQPEWNLFKLGTGQTPAMVCLNGTTVWEGQGTAPETSFGVPELTAGIGCLPFLQAVGNHGGAVQTTFVTANPMLYKAGTTYAGGGIPTTVSALNTLGSIAVPATVAFSAGGGNGVLVCGDGLHPFTYTGLTANTSLNGVVIAVLTASNANGNYDQTQGGSNSDGHLSTVANGAQIWPAALNLTLNSNGSIITGPVNSTSYNQYAWVLQWSSASWSTLSASTPSGAGITTILSNIGYADAQCVNANGNLNTQLDQIAVLAADISPAPLIFRPLAESNNGSGASSFWYDATNLVNTTPVHWGYALFKYCVGYLTGQNGYSGQPVTATPVHNVLFAVNSATGGTGTIGNDFPTVSNVGYVADIIGVDQYSATWGATSPKATFTSMIGVTGYTNVTPILMEAYGNTAAHYDPNTAQATPFGTGGNTTGDLAGLSSLKTGGNYNSARAFASASPPYNLQVMTSTGVRTVTYTGVSSTGSNPNKQVTFTGLSTTGVPTGSIIDTTSPLVANTTDLGYVVGTSSATANTGNANFLTGIKDATTTNGCHFCINPSVYNLGTENQPQSMLFQAGFNAVMQDSATVNLPTPGNWSIFGWGAGNGTEWSWQSPLLGMGG